MKKLTSFLICVTSVFALLSGCSSDKQADMPIVNSGAVDEQYVGDPYPILENEYFQTPQEAEAHKEIVKAIEEEKVLFDGGGLSGH